MKSSRIPGFYKLTPKERLEKVREFASLSEEECSTLMNTGSLEMELFNRMIENVVGTFELPLGIAVNFLINGKDYLIPMAIEEPSVVAACSYAAKMARVKGGFQTSSTDSIMIGQIQVVDVANPMEAKQSILSEENKDKILELANAQDPTLIEVGGGAKDIEARVIDTSDGPMVIIHLLVDVRDAMGANAVNTMCEAVAPLIERISGGRVYLRIVSNLATKRLCRAHTVVAKEVLERKDYGIGGDEVVDGILKAYSFAEADPYRAATHNKGVMNGITAVVRATGNDTRAIESGAHAYAARDGKYKPLTTWGRNKDEDLVGTIELPMAVGLIGGATTTHPGAKVVMKILGVQSARELGEVIASVGLAQNLAALRALATEGIQKGHMALHARNVAIMAGAKGEDIDWVADRLVKENKVRLDRAKELVDELCRDPGDQVDLSGWNRA
jgi:hydroxymethylglutaryl-CoA reductase